MWLCGMWMKCINLIKWIKLSFQLGVNWRMASFSRTVRNSIRVTSGAKKKPTSTAGLGSQLESVGPSMLMRSRWSIVSSFRRDLQSVFIGFIAPKPRPTVALLTGNNRSIAIRCKKMIWKLWSVTGEKQGPNIRVALNSMFGIVLESTPPSTG